MTAPSTPQVSARRPPWRRWVVVLFALAVVAPAAFFGWRWLRDRSEREEAIRLAHSSDFHRAEPVLRRYAERHPDEVAVVRELAQGYLATDQLPEADRYFARWCELEANSAEPFEMRIKLWKKLNRLNEMAEDGKRVVERDPSNKDVRLNLPDWLFRLGRLDEAEQACQAGLKLLSNNPWLLLLQADIHRRRGRTEAAVALVDQLIRDYPTFGEAMVLRGTLYLEAGQPEKARDILKRALGINGPHRPRTLYQLSLALSRTGQKDEAERMMAEARAYQEEDLWKRTPNHDNPDLQVRYAEALLQSGKADSTQHALDLLHAVLAQNPENAEAHKLLAAYYEKEGQPDRAAEHRRRANSQP